VFPRAIGNGSVGDAELLDSRDRSGTTPRHNPLAEADGLVRDVLAAVRNLEQLLRSPLIGRRALVSVIPGLEELCHPLHASIDELLGYASAGDAASTGAAVRALSAQIGATCERLRSALAEATASAMDAKARLAFEVEVRAVGVELHGVRQLMTLLRRATEAPYAEVDLDIREVVREVFAAASRRDPHLSNRVPVVTCFQGESFGLRGSPQIVMPLLGIGLALVHRAVQGSTSLEAVCRPGQPVVIHISPEPAQGEIHSFDPPTLIGPSLICAETAARLMGARFDFRAERVTMSCPALSAV